MASQAGWSPNNRPQSAAGFDATVLKTQLGDIETIQQGYQGHRGVVLDYMGHPPDDVTRLRRRLTNPVLDLGSLTMSILTRTVD